MFKILQKALSFLPFERFRNPFPVIGVIKLTGVIGGTSLARRGFSFADLSPLLEKVFSLHNLKVAVFIINSPGGSPVQSALIAKRIRSLAEEKNVEVWAFCEDVAASGGYWLALAADKIFALETSIVGSIGVVSGGFGFNDAIKKLGIERRLYTSGNKKAILDPFKPEKETDVKHLKSIQAEIHKTFKDHVKSRRGGRLMAKEAELFSGAFWSGCYALELGLIDGIGDMHSEIEKQFGKKYKLKEIGPKKSIFRERLGFTDLDHKIFLGINTAFSVCEERMMWNRFGL